MSDFAEHLPLSNRPRADESAVSGGWAREAAAALTELARVLDAHPSLAASPSGDGRRDVADAVRTLLTRLPRRPHERLLAILGAIDTPSPALSAVDSGRLAELLVLEAARLRSARRGPGIRALGEAVVLLVDVARRNGLVETTEPQTLGAVALDLAVRQQSALRPTLQRYALVAASGGWRIGSGAVRRCDDRAIVLFLAGRGPLPDEVPAPPERETPGIDG